MYKLNKYYTLFFKAVIYPYKFFPVPGQMSFPSVFSGTYSTLDLLSCEVSSYK